MNKTYVYEDLEEAVAHDLEKADMYWKGRDDGRLEAGGGIYTLMGGIFIGSVTVAIIWIMCSVWL
jgi:hypothetical protein